jgi:ArsR family transcriptional regulator
MNRGLAARCLAELGNLTRLDIYKLLAVGDVQTRLDVPASTLAFHLRGLINVGLVSQEKVGREVICRVKHSQLTAVIEFLLEECCKGFDAERRAATTRRAG